MTHHGEGLLRLTKDPALVDQLKADYRQATLSGPDRAMLDYAAKLTQEPWTMTEKDVLRLREAGFEDRDILHINMIAGYYAFVNRLADGLGVELERFWSDPPPERA
jgi:uncharacterized peroxidase-related enzyme